MHSRYSNTETNSSVSPCAWARKWFYPGRSTETTATRCQRRRSPARKQRVCARCAHGKDLWRVVREIPLQSIVVIIAAIAGWQAAGHFIGVKGRQGDNFSHLVAVEIPRGRTGRPFTVQNVTIWHVWLPDAVIGDIIQFVRAEQCINITPLISCMVIWISDASPGCALPLITLLAACSSTPKPSPTATPQGTPVKGGFC